MSSRFPRIAGVVIAAVAGVASAHARELRVCADPNNLPFSAKDGSGFENRIATLLADEMDAKLVYTWRARRRGFLRNTGLATMAAMVGTSSRRIESHAR